MSGHRSFASHCRPAKGKVTIRALRGSRAVTTCTLPHQHATELKHRATVFQLKGTTLRSTIAGLEAVAVAAGARGRAAGLATTATGPAASAWRLLSCDGSIGTLVWRCGRRRLVRAACARCDARCARRRLRRAANIGAAVQPLSQRCCGGLRDGGDGTGFERGGSGSVLGGVAARTRSASGPQLSSCLRSGQHHCR